MRPFAMYAACCLCANNVARNRAVLDLSLPEALYYPTMIATVDWIPDYLC